MEKKSCVLIERHLGLSLFIFLSLSLALLGVSAIGSTNYNISGSTVSSGSGNASSENYNNNIIAESVSGNASSSLYKNCFGFFCISGLNIAPNDATNVGINATSSNNQTMQNLSCFGSLTDPDGDKMNVSVRWYLNKSINLTIDYNSSYSNGTFFIANLHYLNTTKGDVWSCSLRIHDGLAYSNWVNSSVPPNITILNSVPSVTLTAPNNGNQSTNRKPTFNWTGSDNDADSLTYEINITLDAGSLCTDSERYVAKESLGSSVNYTVSPYLNCLWDNFDNYTWKVRAYDGSSYGNWTSSWSILINSQVIISLPVSQVNFGILNGSGSDNTTDNSPPPLSLRNDGNVYTNISVNFTNLWGSVSMPNETFRFKVRNETSGCFIFENTTTSWTNSPLIITPIIHKLNFTSGYQSGCDNASIDLLIEVPINEPPGNKSSIITFTGVLGEKY